MAAAKGNKASSSRSPRQSVKKSAVKAVAKASRKTPAAKPAVTKKAQRQQPAAAKPPVRNSVSRATPVRQAPPKAAAPARKTITNPAAPLAKPATKKAPATAAAAKKDLMKKTVSTPAPSQAKGAPAQKAASAADPKKPRFNKSDLDQFRVELLAMRDRITGQSGAMRNAALQRTDEVNTEEDGTDAFMRLQTLEQVSSQQQIISNIDESLRSIEKGSYGVCDMCGELINNPRLSVLPFAKNCIKCQSEMERPNRHVGRR